MEVPQASYDFKDTLDLGGVFSLDLVNDILKLKVFPSDLFDARQSAFPTTGNFDGTEANDVDAQLFVRELKMILIVHLLLIQLLNLFLMVIYSKRFSI